MGIDARARLRNSTPLIDASNGVCWTEVAGTIVVQPRTHATEQRAIKW
jgi:hypothetical protein